MFTHTESLKSSAVRMSKLRDNNFEFIGVDGEGAGRGSNHRYVLLGVGDNYYENIRGISWKEAFEFLYSNFLERPTAAFAGFFLGYDFTQILKSLPEERARMLLTDKGINARKRRSSGKNNKPFPVRYDSWEFDMLPGRRLQIRPQSCNCIEKGRRDCQHKQLHWMYICDSGPFWQTSLLNVINPQNWKFPIVSMEEYSKLEAGKANRSMTVEEYVQNRKTVIEYNKLENAAFARAMEELRQGFSVIGVRLQKQQWFGPGQAAAAWFKANGVPRRETIEEKVPEEFLEAARKSYFGGWFEIFSHGHVHGFSYEYDINSAYPYIIANLPCLLHGRYDSGTGSLPKVAKGNNRCTLVYARVEGHDPYIGSMLNRDKNGRIRRPKITEGWYWWHEIEAAKRAGLVDKVICKEWRTYSPCRCPNPLRGFKDLYEHRLRVGKESILGKSSKLTYNSGYGKFAQSTGTSPYGNWIYASLITAGCRKMILDAIATHPGKTASVLMVATDGIFFDSPHPTLPTSKNLGEWDYSVRENLTLFKPGVYWDDTTRRAIRSGETLKFKARGVNARDFAKVLAVVDNLFEWSKRELPESLIPIFDGDRWKAFSFVRWPAIKFEVSFSVTSAKTALNRNNWTEAGATQEEFSVWQDADPMDKRMSPFYDPSVDRIRSEPTGIDDWEIESVPYEKRYGIEDPFSLDTKEFYGMTKDGDIATVMQIYAHILTGKKL